MNLEVGSNLYQNTDGTIEFEGVPQIQVSLKPSTNALMVNFALFDDKGVMKAKLVDSTLMFNEQRAYEVSKSPSKVVLTHAQSQQIILQMELKSPDVVVMTKGNFYTVKGRLLEVSPTEWRIDKKQTSGITQDAKGGAVKIG
ncbi:hypothetical protein [Petrachloros mirabilis]